MKIKLLVPKVLKNRFSHILAWRLLTNLYRLVQTNNIKIEFINKTTEGVILFIIIEGIHQYIIRLPYPLRFLCVCVYVCKCVCKKKLNSRRKKRQIFSD